MPLASASTTVAGGPRRKKSAMMREPWLGSTQPKAAGASVRIHKSDLRRSIPILRWRPTGADSWLLALPRASRSYHFGPNFVHAVVHDAGSGRFIPLERITAHQFDR